MELPKQILSWPQADAGLIRSVLGLARNLCADDNRKNKLVSDGSMALMVHAMRSEACREDSHLMEHGIACLAAMSLRFPSNAVKIVQCGATEVVTKAMTKFMASRPSLVRQGCTWRTSLRYLLHFVSFGFTSLRNSTLTSPCSS